MDIIQSIKIMVDLLDKEPNLKLIDIDVMPHDAYIKIIIWKPPKERKEVDREDKSFL